MPSQALDRAEAGQRVVLTADAKIAGLDSTDVVWFEIERGHIGSTEVELSSYEDGSPSVVAVVIWDGNRSGGRNIRQSSVSSKALSGTKLNEYSGIAQLNFWYYRPGRHRGFEGDHGNRATPLTPSPRMGHDIAIDAE